MKQVVLLKLSGEAMSKVNGIGIDMEKVKAIALEIKELKDTGVALGIVVGAGNMWRGRDAATIGMDRVSADQMGMLGTILNAMALAGAFETIGVKAKVMSSIPVGNITEPFNRNHAKMALEKDEIVIFSKKEKAIKRLPAYENISAKNDVFSELKSLFGEKNVKVREKSIEKSQKKR